MKFKGTISPAESEFWMDTDRYSDYISDDSSDGIKFNVDMVRLASIRLAISNFVRILTRKNIPVHFHDDGSNFNLNGDVIYLSAKIRNMQDFDCAVGQALHEGAHTLKTDFDIIKTTWANIPPKILKLSDSKNIRRSSLEKFIHNMWNVIEDRYIDNYVFNEAPGYRGYYVSLYEKFWNCPEVDEYLLSDYFRYPSLKSYDYRITNFTNENTDLLALPCLEDIARVIDISHIDRLETTKDRVDTAFKVVEIVIDCVDRDDLVSQPKKSSGSGDSKKKTLSAEDFFDFGDEPDTSDTQPEDMGKKMVDEISDIMSGRDTSPDKPSENDDATKKISDGDILPDVEDDIDKVIEKQRKFLRGEFPKEKVTESQKTLLNLVEKNGITLVKVDLPVVNNGETTAFKIDCIVVHKMTRELMFSGTGMFPLCSFSKIGSNTPTPPQSTLDAVNKGVVLGSKLGRKIQLRNEVKIDKTIRKKSGKINRRQLHEAVSDVEELFYRIDERAHSNINLHITVDASTSMSGDKWEKTMTAVVAICKAASMVNNIHVTVSFRTSQSSNDIQLPYVILAYDSKVDKFSKVKTLFPYLTPNGCTPEGLAYGAIMKLFADITPDEERRYFLNLSDGEPYFISQSPPINYYGDVGVTHTKTQVDKIRNYGVEIMSYFIDHKIYGSDKRLGDNPLQKDFKKMYGKDSKFINVESIVDLAKTINQLFLDKSV